jgi:uroporphyrin-III C-methyltransferase/precorrin-2 dehydrogenase/sirohydrochlorin ferrochelatase/uroporphyrin-III C-methyltransferase
MSNQPTGKVILAAAGPGDPELITVRATRFLRKADVVIVDRLVSSEIIQEYVSPDATVIYAGKQAGKGYSTRQTTINQMILDHALEGKLVVRLKGGDVSIFSNILDELETLVANNIPYEIIPGVTSALGAAAYAGIPLTARDHATAVRFLTYYKSDVVTDEYWNDLSKTDDTLVFYMSAESLVKVVTKLREHGIAQDRKIALIEQATTPLQRVRIFDFNEDISAEKVQFISPGLVIIGKVVSLHEKFSWLKNYNGAEYYFQPLTKAMSAAHLDAGIQYTS